MDATPMSTRWAPFIVIIAIAGVALLSAPGADAAVDAIQLWNEDFSGHAKVIRDGAVVGITATDLSSVGGSRNATVSDPTNPGDGINVTLYDDGTHGDAVANDGIYTGNFTVCSDGGSSGSCTSEAGGVIDIAEGEPVSVYVDLDGDGSHTVVTVSTDYTGPGMATPFTGGYVHGELIITITIIVEGEAPLDPASVTYSVDTGLPAMFTQIAPDTFQAIIDTYLLEDGPHTVSTLSMDEAGNIGMGTFDIIVDNTVPDILYVCTTIASNGDVLIDTSVSDLHLDTGLVRWNWDGGNWTFPSVPGNDILFTVTIPYDDIVPGEHGTTVIAEDLAGNSMTLITRWILPEQDINYLVVDPIVVDPRLYIGCETVPIPVDLLNEGEVPLDLEFGLVVDELSIETLELRVNADTPETIWIDWTWLTPGLHNVDIVITHVKDPGTGGPEFTFDVKDPFGNDLFMLPEPLKIFTIPPIDEADAYSGNTVRVTPIIVNWEGFSKEAIVQLVVDGVVVDNVTTDIPAYTNHSVELKWPNAKQGTHEVEVRVFQPGFYGTDEPVDTAILKTELGGPVHIDWPDSFKILYTPPIDFSKTKPGDNVKVETVITNFEDSPRRAVVQLLVDGVVVDTVNTDIPAITNKTFELNWPMVKEGDHEVEIRVYDPDWYGIDNPVHISTVENSAGGPIHIEGSPTVKDDDKTPVDQFLDVFEPINNYLPLEWVPERIRPWTFPLILIGTILIIAIIAGTRRKPKKKDIPAKEPEIKPVQMPPVTATQATQAKDAVAPGKPGPDLDDGFPDRPKDAGKVIPLTAPGVFTAGIPDIGTTGEDGGRPTPLDAPGVTTKPIPLASWQGTDPSTATTPEPPSTGTTTTKGPDKPPASVPPIVPPIASTTSDDEGKGDPCVEIIKSQTRARGEVSDAQAAANDAKKKERDARDEVETAGRKASEAERKANTAQKECDDARKEYEGYGVEEAEKEARAAEDRLKDMEGRLKELEGDIPTGDGVSLEPKPGYHSVGVGRGTMILPTNIYYRDAQAERDHMKKVDDRWKEFKKTKKDLDKAKDDAKVERREADEADEKAKDAKRRMEEACKKAKGAREEANTLRGAATDAETKAATMGTEAQAATEKVAAEKAEAQEDMARVNDCKDCLAAVRRTLNRIENLKRDYRSLKGGSALRGPQRRHNQLDGNGVWDDYWDSFKRLRDNAKALAEIQGFTEADLPKEFSGLWDWGGGKDEPVDYLIGATGTYVGMRAEDYVKAPIPTDTIKAVGGLYIYFQARLDPEMSDGRTTLWEHLEPNEALEAELAFKRFPRTMTNGIKGFEKLYKMAELDGEIGEGLKKWQDCLDGLPETPETPEVDFDKLCYKQCRDKLAELQEAERKMRELVDRAQDCEPDGLDGKLQKANELKGQLDRMGDFMDKTSKGLEDYRKAMKASSSCYISTAAYGSPLAPELDTLRGFRDRVLLPTPSGKLLVDHYYRTAPEIADRLETRENERVNVRGTVGLAVRLIHAREGRGPVTSTLLSLATVWVYVLGSLQAWLLTRR